MTVAYNPRGRAANDDATTKQLDFLRKLAAEREVPMPPVLTKLEASREIDRLLAMPRPVRAAHRPAAPSGARPWDAISATLADAPDGRYAIPNLEVDGWDFYRLRAWRGRRYFDRIVGSGYGNGFNKVRSTWTQLQAAADAIKVDPYAAAKAFSTQHGVCARCLAGLTDPVSVATGIGPECRRHWADRIPGSVL